MKVQMTTAARLAGRRRMEGERESGPRRCTLCGHPVRICRCVCSWCGGPKWRQVGGVWFHHVCGGKGGK